MLSFFIRVQNFLKREDGINTVEIVIIIAILVGLALLFKNQIYSLVNSIMGDITGNPNQWISNPTSTPTPVPTPTPR